MIDSSPVGTVARSHPGRIAPLLLGAALCTSALLASPHPALAADRSPDTNRFAFTGTYRYEPASKATLQSRYARRQGTTASLARTPRDESAFSRRRPRHTATVGAGRAKSPPPIVIRAPTNRAGTLTTGTPRAARRIKHVATAQGPVQGRQSELSRSTRSNLGLAPGDPQQATGSPLPITRQIAPAGPAESTAAVNVALSRAVDGANRPPSSVTSGSGPDAASMPPLPARYLRANRSKRVNRRALRRAARPVKRARKADPVTSAAPKPPTVLSDHPDWAANALFRPD